MAEDLPFALKFGNIYYNKLILIKNMFFIDWLFIITVLTIAANVFWPESTGLASVVAPATASAVRAILGF